MFHSGQRALDFLQARRNMIENQIRARGVKDPRVLDAMMAMPREEFIPPVERHRAYGRSSPRPGSRQDHQRFHRRQMTEQLRVEQDIGCSKSAGSGTCAIWPGYPGTSYSIERIDALRERAARLSSALETQCDAARRRRIAGLPEFARTTASCERRRHAHPPRSDDSVESGRW